MKIFYRNDGTIVGSIDAAEDIERSFSMPDTNDLVLEDNSIINRFRDSSDLLSPEHCKIKNNKVVIPRNIPAGASIQFYNKKIK